MNLLEFIGFIVSLLALFVLMIKKVIEERRRRANPEKYEREEQEQAEKLKAFLNAVHGDMQSAPPPTQKRGGAPSTSSPSPPRGQPTQQRPPKHTSSLDDKYKGPGSNRVVNRNLTPPTARDAYQLKPERSFRSNRALKTISHLKSRRDLIIIHEILDKPKGLKASFKPGNLGNVS